MSEQCTPEPISPQPPPVQACALTLLSDWEEWSGCSATCGGGKRGRVKGVRAEAACGDEPCIADIHEIGNCNDEACESEFELSYYQHADNHYQFIHSFLPPLFQAVRQLFLKQKKHGLVS